MDDSFEKWSSSIGDDHQSIRRSESKHVAEKVFSQFAILGVVIGVIGEGASHHEEKHQDDEHL